MKDSFFEMRLFRLNDDLLSTWDEANVAIPAQRAWQRVCRAQNGQRPARFQAHCIRVSRFVPRGSDVHMGRKRWSKGSLEVEYVYTKSRLSGFATVFLVLFVYTHIQFLIKSALAAVSIRFFLSDLLILHSFLTQFQSTFFHHAFSLLTRRATFTGACASHRNCHRIRYRRDRRRRCHTGHTV